MIAGSIHATNGCGACMLTLLSPQRIRKDHRFTVDAFDSVAALTSTKRVLPKRQLTRKRDLLLDRSPRAKVCSTSTLLRNAMGSSSRHGGTNHSTRLICTRDHHRLGTPCSNRRSLPATRLGRGDGRGRRTGAGGGRRRRGRGICGVLSLRELHVCNHAISTLECLVVRLRDGERAGAATHARTHTRTHTHEGERTSAAQFRAQRSAITEAVTEANDKAASAAARLPAIATHSRGPLRHWGRFFQTGVSCGTPDSALERHGDGASPGLVLVSAWRGSRVPSALGVRGHTALGVCVYVTDNDLCWYTIL